MPLFCLFFVAGFLTVDETFNSNIFFWFFPAQASFKICFLVMCYFTHMCFLLQNANRSAPLLLWLQGGPGGSSLFGLFVENGPLYVDRDAQGNTCRHSIPPAPAMFNDFISLSLTCHMTPLCNVPHPLPLPQCTPVASPGTMTITCCTLTTL